MEFIYSLSSVKFTQVLKLTVIGRALIDVPTEEKKKKEKRKILKLAPA